MRSIEEIKANGLLSILTCVESDGVFQLRANMSDPIAGKTHWVKFTRGMGWEHLCVAGRSGKLPTWELMCRAKSIFWGPEECCIQFHPRESQYVDNSDCLHIWKPMFMDLPEPDTLLVGFQDMSQAETKRVTNALIDSLTDEEKLALASKVGIKLNRKVKRASKL